MASARLRGPKPSASPLPVARSRLIAGMLPSVSKNSRFFSVIGTPAPHIVRFGATFEQSRASSAPHNVLILLVSPDGIEPSTY